MRYPLIKKFFWTLILGLILTFFGTAAGLAYEQGEVKSGGTISGRVTLNGPMPVPRAIPIVLYPFGDYCRKISDGYGRVLLREFNVDSSGDLQDAVVVVQNVRKGKPFRFTKNEFITTNCMFHPYDVPEDEQFGMHHGHMVHIHPLVIIMRNDQLVSVLNKDPIVHNAQVYQPEKGNQILNFPIPVSGDIHGGYVHVESGKKIVQLICGMHEYMQSWGWVVDNPYYAKTKKDGAFTIDNLPPGSYRLTVWHPQLKPIEKEVTVPPDGNVWVNFEFDSSEVVRPVYETQSVFRMGPGYEPPFRKPEDVTGCEGPFCVRD